MSAAFAEVWRLKKDTAEYLRARMKLEGRYLTRNLILMGLDAIERGRHPAW